ncbi:hypothetical protein [Prosthecodimorpha hirschii]|uniref:hypothetical protein n=1 Tax=Prosthecodimorpha hirschii TaxID=665126 RepID=UPI00112A676F|nr:hypothetical protein [Prosthecomicrobium hirschii]
MADPRSANRNYPVPSNENTIEQDFLRLIELVGLIDADLAALIVALAGKSDIGHGHAIGEIIGLATALAAKADAAHNHALSGLSDVTATGAPTGTVLVKTAGGWQAGGLDAAIIQSGTIDAARLPTVTTGLAPLASPAFTGIPTAPTPAPGTNTTQLATTAFVAAAAAALVASSPATLDTLNELAAALGNDANFATTVTTALAAKAPLASPTFTGTPAAPTAAGGTNTAQVATTAFVTAAVAAGIAAITGYVPIDVGSGSVGAFIIARKTNSSSASNGSTVSGSNLQATYYDGTSWTGSGSLSGTWRNVSGQSIPGSSGGSGLWQRIS